MSLKESESVSVEKALTMIRGEASKIEHSVIYFEMRRWGARNVVKETVDLVKVLVTMDRMKLPITTHLTANILGRSRTTVATSLHQLGDKGLIMLHREPIGGNEMCWHVNPDFLKMCEGKL